MAYNQVDTGVKVYVYGAEGVQIWGNQVVKVYVYGAEGVCLWGQGV